MAKQQIHDSLIGSSSASQNLLENPGFEIWQRGTSFNSPLGNIVYTADRWSNYSTPGAYTYTISQDTTSANIDVVGLSSMKVNVTAAPSPDFMSIRHDLEPALVAALRGQTITLSIRMKTTRVGFFAAMNDNVGNTVNSNTHTGSGNFETLKCTLTVGLTASSFQIFIYTALTTNFGTVWLDNAQLVLGTTAPTQPVFLHPQQDLERCQRYYEQSWVSRTFLIAHVPGPSSQMFDSNDFCVEKRVAPTITIDGTSVVEYARCTTTASTSSASGSWPGGPAANSITTRYFFTTTTRNTDQTSFDGALYSYRWTAVAD